MHSYAIGMPVENARLGGGGARAVVQDAGPALIYFKTSSTLNYIL